MKDYLRELAKTNRWQLIYSKAKNLSCITLFNNTNNLSGLQVQFLYWLGVYNVLYQELASNEKYLTLNVIQDDIECDAYLYYREHKPKDSDKIEGTKNKQPVLGIPSLVRRD